MSTAQYLNRQYDYQIVQPIENATTAETRLSLELFSSDNSGFILTGIRKLAQRWLMEFLTISGSMTKLPARGSTFMQSALSGKLRSSQSVEHEFARAAGQVAQNLAVAEEANIPADEQLSEARLVSFTVDPPAEVNADSGTTIVYLNLRIQIISLAGNNYETILPIQTTPRDLR